MTFDLIVIGAGPAGITAAVYAVRKGLKLLVITKDIGGQAAWSGDIENYTGYQFITGPELAAKFEEHMRGYGIVLKEDEEVLALDPSARVPVTAGGSLSFDRLRIRPEQAKRAEGLGMPPSGAHHSAPPIDERPHRTGDAIVVRTSKGSYEAKSAIVASGKKSRELGVPGEKEFKNKGLTYCATCDGPLFAGKDVAVVGGGNSALDATLQLVRIARNIALINNTASLGGDDVMREKVLAAPNVTVYGSARVTAVRGEKTVNAVTMVQGGKEVFIPVRGVFVEIGLVPNAEFAPALNKNAAGEISVNCRNETNIPGIFAAGDVTDVPEKQIIIAAGEGAKAALSVFRYLMQKKERPE